MRAGLHDGSGSRRKVLHLRSRVGYLQAGMPEPERRPDGEGAGVMAERFKAIVRRRGPEDDEGTTAESIWPGEFRWVADWNRWDADTGAFRSGCTSPSRTHAEALAEAIEQADEVRRRNARDADRMARAEQ